jgi:uncharacterized protein YbjT (DUF2867 family)
MTDNTPAQKTTLVLGGTGKTGRRVAERLVARGRPVRIGSRSGAPPFDWHDPRTWPDALHGADAVYVVYYPDLALPQAAAAIRSFTELAVELGVRRLVLLSGRGEEEAHRSEQPIRESGVEWTVLRGSWFAQNFSEDFLLDSVRAGVVALPAGTVAEPFLDAEDIADIAVAALTGDGHAGRVYELTGPRLLTFADAAEEIATASGREVRYVPVGTEQFAAALTDTGMPAEDAAQLADTLTQVLDGRNAHLTDGVQRALGRAPRDFSDYARDAAATGVWGQ